jgi:predicted NBD/HSP70 family sugar kinase
MYLAVDIGATKVLLAVFTNKGKIAEEHKFPTAEKYDALIRDFAAALLQLKTREFDRVVVAVPGRLDRQRGIGIAFGNRPWQNVPIQQDMEKILHTPVVIENDTKLAALSEAVIIKKDFKKVLYVTISTGISAGLIVNGVIDPELADSESGQMWFDYHGKPTQWEDFASGRAIVTTYGKQASEITDPKAWQAIAHNIAVGLIELIAVIQPEVIILGGGVGSHYDKFKTPLAKELRRYELPIVPIPPIRKAQHPEEAVIYGCYQLAKEPYA